MSRVVVVGAGFGGIAAAVRLAKRGHQVTLVERRHQVGGAVGFVEQDGFRWDAGPTATALPAVLRDLFRKSGRPLEREVELVPLETTREHRFADATVLAMPSGSRGDQIAAVESALGGGRGEQWADYVHDFAETWDQLRRGYLERPYLPGEADRETAAVLRSRRTLFKQVTRTFSDERLRRLALFHATMDGHDPRNVPAWLGMWDYVEHTFGSWTVAGGMGRLAEVLERRLVERGVTVLLDTTARDLRVEDGLAVGVLTDHGEVAADEVVVAMDPRYLPVLAPVATRTMPAIPPVVCHLGLSGDVPDLPREVVLHGDPTLVVRTGGQAPAGGAAWTVLGRGRVSQDVVFDLAFRGIDVRRQVEVRVDRSPRVQVEELAGSSYGVLWQGRATVDRRLVHSVANVHGASAHAAAGSGLPLVGLSAAAVAERIGAA